MRQVLQDKLFMDFPIFFANRNLSISESGMFFGIQCGDGWESILRKVAEEIEEYNNQLVNAEYCIKARQIKEKYGGIRIYLNIVPDFTEKLIHEAEELSYKTCELCGAPGEPNKKGWVITLCEKCREKRNEDM